MAKNKINTKLVYSLMLVALIFTLVDGFFHYSFEIVKLEYSLTAYMFGKFIGTVVIGYFAVLCLSKQKLKNKVLWFTAIIVAILEIRYFLSGDYTMTWHATNLFLHFTVLYFPSKYFLREELQ